jgi:hypothetical protein
MMVLNCMQTALRILTREQVFGEHRILPITALLLRQPERDESPWRLTRFLALADVKRVNGVVRAQSHGHHSPIGQRRCRPIVGALAHGDSQVSYVASRIDDHWPALAIEGQGGTDHGHAGGAGRLALPNTALSGPVDELLAFDGDEVRSVILPHG